MRYSMLRFLVWARSRLALLCERRARHYFTKSWAEILLTLIIPALKFSIYLTYCTLEIDCPWQFRFFNGRQNFSAEKIKYYQYLRLNVCVWIWSQLETQLSLEMRVWISRSDNWSHVFIWFSDETRQILL